MLLIAGITNLETTVAIEGFPFEYAKSRFVFHGISDRIGGVGYNVARVLSAVGEPAMLATLLGRDAVGDVLEARLRALPHLDPEGLCRFHEASLRTVVLKAPDGSGAMNTDLKESQEISFPAELRGRLLERATHLHTTNINWALDFARDARERGLPVSTDVQNLADPRQDAYNDRFLALADTVFFSAENLQVPVEEAIALLFDRFPIQRFIVTQGAGGVLFAERGAAPLHQPAPELPAERPANVTGAGDAFAAGTLAALRRGSALPDAVEIGQAMGRRWILGEL